MITREKILIEMAEENITVLEYAIKHNLEVQDVWDIINGK